MKAHIDLLLHRLRGIAAAGTPTDMVKWLNFRTFDLISDLVLESHSAVLKQGFIILGFVDSRRPPRLAHT